MIKKLFAVLTLLIIFICFIAGLTLIVTGCVIDQTQLTLVGSVFLSFGLGGCIGLASMSLVKESWGW